jgi:50S ribosomal protein L16 3-hydroxylase
MVDAVARELRRMAPSRRDTCRTLLEHLTEPKASVVFDPPERALGPRQFAQAAARHGLRLDLRSRMLYQGADLALNGELAPATPGMAPLLRRLADLGCLAGEARGTDKGSAAWAAVPHEDQAPLRALLHQWYCAGWLHIAA